jgi:hypothetical protein
MAPIIAHGTYNVITILISTSKKQQVFHQFQRFYHSGGTDDSGTNENLSCLYLSANPET